MKRFLIIIALITGTVALQAQLYVDMNLMGGISDIHAKQSILPLPSEEILPAGGLFVRYGMNARYALRGGINGAYRDQENWAGDLYGLFEFSFHPLNPTKPKANFSPYIGAGISYLFDRQLYQSAILDEANSVIFSDPDHNSKVGYWMRNFSIPFHVGARYLLASNLTIGIEWAIRHTFQINWAMPEDKMTVSRWRSYVGATIGYSFVLWNHIRVPFY